jgi:predicted RNA-binding protein with PUA-like domain
MKPPWMVTNPPIKFPIFVGFISEPSSSPTNGQTLSKSLLPAAETAFDPKEPYYDPKSSRDSPKWYLVHVEFRRKLDRLIGLGELKGYARAELAEMPLLKMSRLSVSSVPKDCWDFILSLERPSTEA